MKIKKRDLLNKVHLKTIYEETQFQQNNFFPHWLRFELFGLLLTIHIWNCSFPDANTWAFYFSVISLLCCFCCHIIFIAINIHFIVNTCIRQCIFHRLFSITSKCTFVFYWSLNALRFQFEDYRFPYLVFRTSEHLQVILYKFITSCNPTNFFCFTFLRRVIFSLGFGIAISYT